MNKNYKRGIAVMLAGCVIAALSGLISSQGTLEEGVKLRRNEYGEGEKAVSLVASDENREVVVYYNLAERVYSEEELEEMLPEFIEELEVVVVGNNDAADSIYEDMNFVSEVEGYPFEISYYTDNSDLVGYDGSLKETVENRETVMLTAEMEYEDYCFQHSFPVVICPPVYTEELLWQQSVEQAIQRADEESAEDTYLSLPTQIEKNQILWREETEGKGVKILLLSAVLGGYFFFADRLQEKNRLQKRKEQLKKEFPEFALKCSMLTGAGMTVRQAFQKMASAYEEGKTACRQIYEEVTISVREMENGVPERMVYQNFGRRCGIRETEKFGNIIARNIRQGAEGLTGILREEAAEAMNMQREYIRKKGETAGTKLLFPMLILLLVVMVMIMIPAFGNFSI